MAVTEEHVGDAERRMSAIREAGFAVGARFDRRSKRIVVALNTGVEIMVPVRLIPALADAQPVELEDVEITPAGLGLFWPRLDADLYVPGLLRGVMGSQRQMAAELGATGGRTRSSAKAAAAQANGLKGGRPRRRVAE